LAKRKKNEHFDSFVSELSRDKHLVNLTSNSQICVGWVAAAGGLEAVALIFLLATKHYKLLEKTKKPKKKTASYTVQTLDIIHDLVSVFSRSSWRCFLHYILYKRIAPI